MSVQPSWGCAGFTREREMDEKNLPAIDLRVQKMAFNGGDGSSSGSGIGASKEAAVEEKKLYVIGIGPGARRTDDGPGRPHFAGKPGDHRLYGIRGPGKRIFIHRRNF